MFLSLCGHTTIVMRFCRGWSLEDMILSEAASSTGRFHSRTTGGNASSLLYSQVLKSTNHLHALYWIYMSVCLCVCVLPWTAHTAGPPSLDSSGLRSCSVSPWTSHWNTRREKTSDFNSRLKVWCERRVMCHIQVLRHKLHVNIVKKLLLLRFFFLFSRRCQNYMIIIWLKVQPVIQISLHHPLWPHLRPVQPDPKVTTPGCCCCPRRVSGGFTKDLRLLQISPPASVSEEL